MTDKLQVSNIFVAVFEKSNLDPLLDLLKARPFSSPRPGLDAWDGHVKFWGTDGTISYVKTKGFSGESVIRGFDFDGRVKSLDRANFARLLADKSKPAHMAELEREKLDPIDLLVVDLYAPNESIFPESMDIGGQSLIRSAIKNYNSVALAFDVESIADLLAELKENNGATTLAFRKNQAKKAAKFIAERTKLEAELFGDL